MHLQPLQWIFILMMLLVLAYVAVRIMGWFVQRALNASDRLVEIHDIGAAAMSSDAVEDEAENGIAGDIAQPATNAANPIAMQQCASNAALLQQFGSNAERVAIQIETLAVVIAAAKEQPFATGTVPETRIIQALFGERASSTNPRYKAIKDALKAAVDQRSAPTGPDPIVATIPDPQQPSRAQPVRAAPDGRRYILDSEGQRQPV